MNKQDLIHRRVLLRNEQGAEVDSGIHNEHYDKAAL